jgi:hypothetical protein
MDIRNLDEELEKLPEKEQLQKYGKRVGIPCKSFICRYNVKMGCNKNVAYHPVFIEGKCQSFQYDS